MKSCQSMFKTTLGSLRSFALQFAFLVLTFGSIFLHTVSAQEKLIFEPATLEFSDDKPQILTIKTSSGTVLEGSTKFEIVGQNKLLKFDPLTLTVTPLASGRTTLKIKYKESETSSISGEVVVNIFYKTVYLLEPVERTVNSGGAGSTNRKVSLVSGQTLDVRAEGIDIKGGAVALTAEVTANNDVVRLEKSTTPTKLSAQPVANSQDSTITVKVNDKVYQEIPVTVEESVESIEVDDAGTPQIGTVNVSIPETETRELAIKVVGAKGSTINLKPEWVIQSPNRDPRVKATVADNKLVLTTKDLPEDLPVNDTITLSIPNRKAVDGVVQSLERVINVTVTPKSHYIELVPSNTFLMPNSKISITGTVKKKRSHDPLPTYIPAFNFAGSQAEQDKAKVWVNLTTSSNVATVSWREPTETEIKNAYGGQLEKRPSEVVIEATATVENKPTRSTMIVRMGRVDKFAPLRVKLNLMDSRTVNDLYGAVTNDEYYALTVRLFNNLKDQDTKEYIGSSILAYSSSIEVAVQLEKKFDNETGSYFPNIIRGGDAKRIAEKRARAAAKLAEGDADTLITTANNARALLQAAFDAQYVAQRKALEQRTVAEKLIAKARNSRNQTDTDEALAAIRKLNDANAEARNAEDNTNQVRAEIARAVSRRIVIAEDLMPGDPSTAVDDGKWHPVTRVDLDRIAPMPVDILESNLFEDIPLSIEEAFRAGPLPAPASQMVEELPQPEPPCTGAIKYRPLTFEMMVNTVDRRDNRSTRSIVFKILEGIGMSTSFVTSIAVPSKGSDLPLGLEKYRNLFLPGIDKLFPSLKEQQRQNIVSQAMKEIEEIPFGSDVTRVIFIPKKSIRGLIRGHESRISEVCPFYFSIEVAIIQKGRTVEQGTVTR